MRSDRRGPVASILLTALTALYGLTPLHADAATATGLSGRVTSAQEGSMEGVLVTARKSGATIAVTVVSDAHGEYRFPAGRLGPGTYAVSIRAVGYDLDGAASVARSNAWFVDFSKEHVGRIDAKTGKIEVWEAPTKGSRPRRGMVDTQGRFWYGGFGTNLIGMFDTNTKTFREWTTPTPLAGPYDAVADKNGDVWSGGQLSDRVVRLMPKSGEMIEYLLPTKTDMRHAFVDNTPKTPAFWVGNNHGASIIKVEPLE